MALTRLKWSLIDLDSVVGFIPIRNTPHYDVKLVFAGGGSHVFDKEEAKLLLEYMDRLETKPIGPPTPDPEQVR